MVDEHSTMALIPRAGHQQLCDQARPAGLVRRPAATASVAVEVFVKLEVVAEVGIVLNKVAVARSRAAPLGVAQKQAREAVREFRRGLVDGDILAGSGGAFDPVVVALVVVEFLHRLDDQEIHGKPDRAAPVGVAAEQSRFGLRWDVSNDF